MIVLHWLNVFILVGLRDQCIDYNGIAHPKNPSKCCASSCGDMCGALNCDEADGGVKACCGSGIQENIICGVNGQNAPCTIGNYVIMDLSKMIKYNSFYK